MAENRYAECTSIKEVLASAGSDWYWEGDGISYDQAEARIRELINEENLEWARPHLDKLRALWANHFTPPTSEGRMFNA